MEFINNIINTLGSIIGYLNSNSGLIAAIATVVLVVITLRYVRLTQEILKATNKPEVIIFLRFNNDGTISLRIENIGTGYASDVEFAGDLLSYKARPQFFGEEGKKIKELPPFKNGIPLFRLWT